MPAPERAQPVANESWPELPRYPWNDLIDMTGGGSESRAIVVALASVHEAINANTEAVRATIIASTPAGGDHA